MKLLSATVHNYRIHREESVEFDSARTLIGGPNETGKSTFIEAIHRGLFLKARGSTALHKSMTSTLHAGHPEVEITFEANDNRYTVRKRFSGQNGTCQLSQADGQSWQGDDAEEHLATLLGSEDAGGRATASKIIEQWAHLWVWQGKSGDDPTVHAESQQNELLQRLQDTGGSVAMQSDLDKRVADGFAKEFDKFFVNEGKKAKANSDLDRAQAEFGEAETRQAAALERLGALQQAMDAYDAAEATLQRTVSDLEKLRKQQQDVKEKITQAEALQQQERDQQTAVEAAKKRQEFLEAAEESITGFRKRISELKAVLEPKQEELRKTESRITDLRKEAGDADRKLQDAQGASRDARLRRDLAAAYVTVQEKGQRLSKVKKTLERIRELQSDIAGHRRRLSELPEVDRKGLEGIQAIESDLAQAKAALNAMAAEIKIISTDQAIQVGDQTLDTGGSRTIAEPTDVNVGDAICLRIHPGGGESLGNARETVRSLQEQLQAGLDQLGLESTKRVSEVVTAREDLHSKIVSTESTLAELGPEETEETHAVAESELTAAEAEVARRQANVKDLEAPESLAAAKGLLDAQEERLQSAEGSEGSHKATREALNAQVAELEGTLRVLRNAIAEDQKTLTGSEAQLELVLQDHGDDATRREVLEAARKALSDVEQALSKTQKSLKELQPELLVSDRDRLERSIEQTSRQHNDANTTRAVSQSKLHSDGADDPKAFLAQADARLSASREHLRSVTRKASAIKLLDKLFQEKQQALADRFSQPLADKITGYVQCIFGTDARAVVSFENNAFKAIRLVRASQAGATGFDALSGGTREQVAAAVRLAIAELLAAKHNGKLPVVFDDAFAYSDPERVQTLQRMLDLGATRGLQIIVLTCNPSDYAGLGAYQTQFAVQSTSTPSNLQEDGPSESTIEEPATPAAVSEDNKQRFLSMLTEQGGKSGNHSLREQLGWGEPLYEAVKEQLVADGRIVLGKGRGGSVALNT